MKRTSYGVLPVALMLATFCSAQAAPAHFRLSGGPQSDIQNILSVLGPVNLRQLDRLSKPLFDDFFTQKDRVYRQPSSRPSLRKR